MALTNQATITLAVNVQNMSGLTSLTRGLQNLRTQIMAVQRNPVMRSATGVSNPAQTTRAATALSTANNKAQIAAIRNSTALAKAQQALGNATGTTTKRIAAQRPELTGLAAKIEAAEYKVDALWRASFRLTMLGSQLSQFGRSILSAVSGVVNEFGDFEFTSLRAAGALSIFNTGADQTKVSTIDLEDAIMATAKQMRLMPTDDIAKSVYFWGSTTGQVVTSQQQLKDVMSQITPIIKGAEMTQTDYETAIKGTYSILAQYYPKVVETAAATQDYSQMSRIAQTVTEGLFFATQKTALEFGDLIQSFKMVGPVAQGVGASFEDIVSLLERLGNLGIRGSMAGRALRQMFIQMARPPKITLQALNALIGGFKQGTQEFDMFHGKSFIDIMLPEGKFVGTETFLKNMYNLTKDLNTQQRIAILGRFSTANLLPAMIALVAQEGRALEKTDGVVKTSAQVHQEWADQFAASWNLLSNSFQGVSGALDRSIESLRITLGRSFADVLKPVMDQVRGIVDQLTAWVNDNPQVVAAIGQLASILGVALVALGAVFTAVGSVIGLVAGLTLAFSAFKDLFLKWTGIGTVVVGIIDSIIRNWDLFVGRFQDAAQSIGRAISNIQGYFGDGQDAVGSFADSFHMVFDTITDLATNAIVVLAHLIEEISKFRPIFDLIKNVGIPILANFMAIFVAKQALMAIGSVTRLTGMLKGITSGVRGIGSVAGLAGKAMGGLKNNLDLVAIAVGAIAFAAYQNNWLHFRDIVDAIADSWRNVDDELNKAFTDIKDKTEILASLNQLGSDGAMSFLSGWRATLSKGGGLLQDMFVEVATGQGVIGDIFGPYLNLGLKSVINSARDNFKDMWQKATFGAEDAQTAVANVNKELQDAGLNVMDFWKAWMAGKNLSGMSPEDAGVFAEAVARSLKNGDATIGEVEANIRDILGLGAYDMTNAPVLKALQGMSDEELRLLGITTRVDEATRQSAETTAKSIMDSLAAFDPSNISLDNSNNVAALLDSLARLEDKVSPEMKKTIDDLLSSFAAGAADNLALILGGDEVQNALLQSLADLGATHIDPAVFADLLGQVKDALAAAEPTDGIFSDDMLQKAIADVFSKNNVSAAVATVYAAMQDFKDGMSDAIHSIFKPDSLKDMLKNAIKDKKGLGNFMDAITSPLLKSALAGEKGSEGKAIAEQWLTKLMGDFETAFPGLLPDAKSKLQTQLSGLFDQSTVKAMDPDMQVFAANILTAMYTDLGQPVPDWVTAIFRDNGGTMVGDLLTGANNALDNAPPIVLPTPVLPKGMGPVRYGPHGTHFEDTGEVTPGATPTASNPYVAVVTTANDVLSRTPPIVMPPMAAPDTSPATTAIATMVTNITTTVTSMGDKSFAWGQHLVGEYARGILAGRGWVMNAANTVALAAWDKLHMSTPEPDSPLRGVDEWGKHLIQRYAKSIDKGTPWARKAAAKAAAVVARELQKGTATTHGVTGKDGDPLGIKKTHKVMTSVKGAHLYSTYDGYLDYLDKVHNHIKDFRTQVVREHNRTVDDLNVGTHKTGGTTKFETNHKKQVEVKITVQSPDGSVNRAQLSAVRKGAMDALVLADAEHIVTVT